MSDAKFTPGPWYVGTQNDGLYVLDGPPSPAPYDGPIPRNHGPDVVATPNWRLPSYEANARLIAAAPETLAALKEANVFILAPAEDLKEGVLSRIRAAIVRAESRS